ncbi:site-specific integrase [uncultured Psychrobacter sp.]|uniref:site-specific integrase n=1 Tax=uncultured Psychrobacter sp. TaxID=259303 RepID=UPI00262C79D6|nr:site-specific integrase [uncultured Psychrobacter sp.]
MSILKIKSIVLNNSNPISLLFDSTTTLPCLYPMLYINSSLKFKSESTQQAYLQGIKQWYEFWQEKYDQSFCKYFREHKSNPELMIKEIDSFILYLENIQVVDQKLIRLGTNPSINYNTLAHRLRAILSYLNYLLDTFSQIYGKSISPEIARYKSVIYQKYDLVKNLSSNHHKAHKNGTNFKSLTEEMQKALRSIISPKALEPLFKSNEAQLRNFLIVRLLLNYGLRTGELLLLTLDSIKPDVKTHNTYLLITDTHHKTDTRITKPQIKNVQSIRSILLEKRDVQFINIYINYIRRKEAKNRMLFLSLQAPYAPLSKSGFKKIIATINENMKSKHPQFFDTNYVDSLDKISAHTLRHTWAYMMLKYNYESYLSTHHKAKAMEKAVENLRKMAGWSLNSTMPYLYASRFMSENANLANIQRITKVDTL